MQCLMELHHILFCPVLFSWFASASIMVQLTLVTTLIVPNVLPLHPNVFHLKSHFLIISHIALTFNLGSLFLILKISIWKIDICKKIFSHLLLPFLEILNGQIKSRPCNLHNSFMLLSEQFSFTSDQQIKLAKITNYVLGTGKPQRAKVD